MAFAHTYAVSLKPDRKTADKTAKSCSCPARTSCYRITAARLIVGLSDN